MDYNENSTNEANQLPDDDVVGSPLTQRDDSVRNRLKLRRVFQRAANATQFMVRRRGDPIRLKQRKLLRQSLRKHLNQSNNEISEKTQRDVENSDVESPAFRSVELQGDIEMTEFIGKSLLKTIPKCAPDTVEFVCTLFPR